MTSLFVVLLREYQRLDHPYWEIKTLMRHNLEQKHPLPDGLRQSLRGYNHHLESLPQRFQHEERKQDLA